MTEPWTSRFVGLILLLAGGPFLWFLHFGFVYGVIGFGGEFGLDHLTSLNLVWGATLSMTAAIAAILLLLRRRQTVIGKESPQAIAQMAFILSCLSLWAIALEAVSLCAVSEWSTV